MKNQNHTSHFTHRTSQKGITLIALIITIIVMLILVGVTINVALNGGLFQKADDATKLTQEAADKEELQLEIVTAYNEKEGIVDLNLLKTNLEKRNWKDVTISGDKLTCTSPKGNTFTVTADGKVSEGGTSIGGGNTTGPIQSEDEELLRKYVCGDVETPKYLTDVLNMRTYTFEPDENTIADANETIKFAGITKDDSYSYIIMRYKRNVYKIQVDPTDYKNVDLILPTNTVEGNLGKYVEYAGNTWIVLRETSSEIELITANATESKLTLEASDYEPARISYNNAVATLVEECKDVTGLEIGGNVIGIRCVGGPEADETKNTDTVDFSKSFEEFKPNDNFPYANYAGTAEEKGLKIGDDKYLDDFNQMEKLGILVTDTPANYWLASRCVDDDSTSIGFGVRRVSITGALENYSLCYVRNTNTSISGSASHPLRPVVTLKSEVLTGATGKGTIDNPIVLN